ncbi:MAG: KH domain-containing protein [Acidobacteriota bacterium]
MKQTTDKPDDMRELVVQIARALVDLPEDVVVEAVEREESTALRLRVAPSDVGKVIGKQGRTARSMRTILGAVSMKHHHRYTLDILEEDHAGTADSEE